MTTLGVAPNLLNSIGPWRRLALVPTDAAGETYRGPGLFMVYVPSRYGGELEITSDRPEAQILVRHPNPDSSPLKDLAGSEIPRGNPFTYDVPKGQYGWFYIFVGPLAGDYRVSAMFRETGLARESKNASAEPLIPWNFWYFPNARIMQADTAWGSATLRPCQKYESAFHKTDVLQWEIDNHNDPDGTAGAWWGHCHDAAPASIVFEEPPRGGKNVPGADFLCEELKFFATEFVGSYVDMDFLWALPGKGRSGRRGFHQENRPSDDPDRFGKVAAEFHVALRKHLLDEMAPVMMDLRDSSGADHASVWNQAIYMYESIFYENPGGDDPLDVEVATFLFANQDFLLSHGTVPTGIPADVQEPPARPAGRSRWARANGTGRDEILRYRLIHRDDGTIAVQDARNRWTSVTLRTDPDTELHAPRFMFAPQKAGITRRPGADGNEKLDRAEVLEMLTLRSRYR